MNYDEKIVDRQVGRNADLFARTIGEMPTIEERYPYIRILISIIEQAHPEWNQAPTRDTRISLLVFHMSKGSVNQEETAEIVRLRDEERGFSYVERKPEQEKPSADAATEEAPEPAADTASEEATEPAADTATEEAPAPAADAATEEAIAPAADTATEEAPAPAADAATEEAPAPAADRPRDESPADSDGTTEDNDDSFPAPERD